jgi:hypothetical protein
MQVGFDQADEREYEKLHAALQRRFNITSLGESKFMLGMRITRDRRAKTIQLDQELYVTKALEKVGLDSCKPRRTPAEQNGSSDERAGHAGSEEPADVQLYQEKVGTLLYAAISTQPDIAFAVNQLTQRMQAPTAADAKACDHVFRYLAGTRDLGLLFGRQERQLPPVAAYADADWGNSKHDRKSVTGWIAMLHGDPVSWASKKQKVVAQSTCEAELYAEAAAINETKWLSGLLDELGLHAPAAGSAAPCVMILGDNQSAQALSRHGVKSERTKHIDIKYHFIQDEVSSGRVQLQWIPTAQQQADILTKPLGGTQHKTLREQLLVRVSATEPAKPHAESSPVASEPTRRDSGRSPRRS